MITYNEKLDETLVSGCLQNGLKYYIIPKKSYAEKRVLLTVKYGSVDDTFMTGWKAYTAPMGTAHFLEHKLFDNENGSAFDEFEALGAYVNAYTSFNNTAYYFSCSDKFLPCLETLFGFVSSPEFTDSSVEKEMGIISQEISMYDDNPAWAAYFDMLSCLYEGHPAKNVVAGTRESIREITKDTLYTCYKSFYVPENMYLICVGGFGERDIELIIEASGRLLQGNGRRAETLLPDEHVNVVKRKSVKKMRVSRPIFQIGFKGREYGVTPAKACAYKLALDLFIGDSSKLREELIKRKLADDSLSFDYVFGEKYGYATLAGESEKPFELLEVCREKAREICENGFCEADFVRLRRKHIGRFIRGFNSVEAITSASAEYAVKDSDAFRYFEGYTQAGLDGCNSLAKEFFREEGYAVSVIEPE